MAVLTAPSLAQHAQFGGFSYKKMTVLEAVDMLDGLIDESDPDVDFPNSFHAFQTAEGIRQAHPDQGAPPPRSSPAVVGEVLPSRAAGVGRADGVLFPGGPCPPSPCLYLLCPGPSSPASRPVPLPDWFHLVGLLHDLGKVLALAGEPQVREGVEGGRQGGVPPRRASQ